MVITYHGLSCFKVQSGDTVLVFDLPSKKSGLKPPRFSFDISLQSHEHPGHNGVSEISREKEYFLINGPGEYEIKGVYVQGFRAYHDSTSGKKYGLNTVYVVRFENIVLCFLGDFGEKSLRPELKEGLAKIDILFIPIAGETVLDSEAARNLINQIQPGIAIPMHYSTEGRKKDVLKSFLAEFGQKDAKPLEKLTIRKKDIPENRMQIIVLSPL